MKKMKLVTAFTALLGLGITGIGTAYASDRHDYDSHTRYEHRQDHRKARYEREHYREHRKYQKRKHYRNHHARYHQHDHHCEHSDYRPQRDTDYRRSDSDDNWHVRVVLDRSWLQM